MEPKLNQGSISDGVEIRGDGCPVLENPSNILAGNWLVSSLEKHIKC